MPNLALQFAECAASFQLHWQSRHDKLHLVRRSGNGLVHDAGRITKCTRQRVIGHDAEADFVGDDGDRAPLTGQGVRETRNLLRPVAF